MSESYEYLYPVINQIVESHGLTLRRIARSGCWLEFTDGVNRYTIEFDMQPKSKITFTKYGIESSLYNLKFYYFKTAKN